ncbi:hypothetical protein [Rhizobium leguminosarum]|uniref:hypothetical protein n=1 Tax=Rhizobium leguminosarum TaxID=384 RepID=UPI003F9873DF
MKIFWSWQSDTHNGSGRYFVRDILNELALEFNGVDGTTEAERPESDQTVEIDHDTLGVAGSPHIADTILRKIREAAVFVADVTPIAKTAAGKLPPNPNVMFELGYALSHLSHERIVLVMNASTGGKLDQLPFDLRYWRGPITYSMRKETDEDTRERVAAQLKADLRERIYPCLLVAANARIAELKQAKAGPQLSVIFAPSQVQPLVFNASPANSDTDTFERIKKSTPLLDPTAQPLKPVSDFTSLVSLAGRREIPLSQRSADEVIHYNRRVEGYYRAYETYLADAREFEALVSRSFTLELTAQNLGTQPATNVTIEMLFPNGITLYEQDEDDHDSEDEGRFPTKPEPPEPPDLTRGSGARITVAPYILPRTLRAFNLVETIRIFRDEQRVEFPIKELMHHEPERLDAILLSFAAHSDVKSFDISYRIRAREIPRPIEGTLRFEIA